MATTTHSTSTVVVPPLVAADSSSQNVIETTVADVQMNDEGTPSQVNGYRVLKQLGEGTFSKVYHCRDGDGHEYALKILNKSFLKRKREYKKIDGKMVFSNAFQKVQKEVAIMKKLAHDNLVKLHEIIDTPVDDKMILVLELITGGQVMKWDDKAFRYQCLRTSSGVLEIDDARRCMRDVIHALEYLHSNFICHRDIKPENILLVSTTDRYKLADFGVAHMTDDSVDTKKTLRNTEGTYHFLAPECTTGDEYDPYKVDIWALGVTMFALLFGVLPFGKKASSLSDVMDSIRVDRLELDTRAIDADCEHLLRSMMTKDPMARITIEQLKAHPWITCGMELLPGLTSLVTPRVEVTREEIEAAFTPVNNFLLMARLKIRMAGRLARARNSIDMAKSLTTDLPAKDLSSVYRRVESFNGFDAEAKPLSDLAFPELPTLEAIVASPRKSDSEPFDGNDATTTTTTATHTTVTTPTKLDGVRTKRRASIRESPTTHSHHPHHHVLAETAILPIDCDALGRRRPSRDTDHDVSAERRSPAKGAAMNTESISATESTPMFAARLSPSKSSLAHLSSEFRLPKLEIPSTSSTTTTPVVSPLSSPLSSPLGSPSAPAGNHRRSLRHARTITINSSGTLTEAESEDAQIGEDNYSSAPLTPPLRHHDHLGGIDGDQESVVVADPLPHRPRKTQDEAKIAIANIIHRTEATSTQQSGSSPMKEPSVMLQRRKSSNSATGTVSAAMSVGEHHRVAPLPVLMEQTHGRPGRPCMSAANSSPSCVTTDGTPASARNSPRCDDARGVTSEPPSSRAGFGFGFELVTRAEVKDKTRELWVDEPVPELTAVAAAEATVQDPDEDSSVLLERNAGGPSLEDEPRTPLGRRESSTKQLVPLVTTATTDEREGPRGGLEDPQAGRGLRRIFSTPRVLQDSHESLRKLMLSRNRSVKAMLVSASCQASIDVAARARPPSLTALPLRVPNSKTGNNAIKSGSCSVQ